MSEKDYIVETLAPEDFDEWTAHCGLVFNMGHEYFERHFKADPYRDYGSIFIIKAGGK